MLMLGAPPGTCGARAYEWQVRVNKKLAIILETYPRNTEKFIHRGLKALKDAGVDLQVFHMRKGSGEDLLGADTFKLPSQTTPE